MDAVITPRLDPAHDVLQYGPQALDTIFAPKSVAVIGATENPGSVGRTIVWNLMSNSFGGTIYPVNPRRPSILGIKAYPNLTEEKIRAALAFAAELLNGDAVYPVSK